MNESDAKYLVAFTLFGVKYKGFKTFYRHFDNIQDAIKFCDNPNIIKNCILYKSVDFSKIDVDYAFDLKGGEARDNK